DSTPVYYDGRLLFPREGSLVAQQFDLKTLQTTGTATPIVHDVFVSPDVDGLMGLAAAGEVIAFRRADTEQRQFAWMDDAGRSLGTVGPVDANEVRLSPDGRSAAIAATQRSKYVEGIWLVDLVRGSTSPLSPDPQNEGHPVWSPDGSRLLYGSD